jgi:hypothetical protein
MGGGEETRISNAGISRIENDEYSETVRFRFRLDKVRLG